MFLGDQGLIKMTGDGLVGRVTKPGIIEVESAINNLDEPTDYFPAKIVNIINQGNIIGGDVGGDVVGNLPANTYTFMTPPNPTTNQLLRLTPELIAGEGLGRRRAIMPIY